MKKNTIFHTVSLLIIKYFSVFLLFPPLIFSQVSKNFSWNLEPTPTFSDIKYIKMFSENSAIAGADLILFLKNGNWQKFDIQPPAKPTSVYAINLNSVWVNVTTKYQESNLYYWNGKVWSEIFNPLANSIYSMKFTDSKNGVISGLGEIARLNKGKWRFLSPVGNEIFQTVLLTKKQKLLALSKNGDLYKLNDNKWEKIKVSYPIRLIKNYGSYIYFSSDSFMSRLNMDDNTIEVIFNNDKLKWINDFVVLPGKEIIAVGNKGLILFYSNGKVSKQESNVNENLNAIDMISKENGWVVGDNGVLLSYGIKSIRDTKEKWKGFKPLSLYSEAKEINDEYGVAAADFNNDGFTDIFTCGLFEQNHFYINKGNFRFIDESEERGLGKQVENKGAVRELNLGTCAGDFDNDGNIDLYVSSLNCKNKLYHNLGDGYFVDYSKISGGVGEKKDRSNAAITGDVDNDGDLDIFIANENTTNRLYLNNGAGIFDEVTEQCSLLSEFGGTGASFADIDNDGDIDLYVTNWSTKNKLYKNLLIESGKLRFIDITDSSNVSGEDYSKSNGVVFTDIDNDADLDLFVTNRKTTNKFYINNGNGKFKDLTENFFGTDTFKSYGISSADFDGDGYKDLYVSNVGKDVFYKNIDGQIFIDKTELYGAGVNGYGTGTAVADFDNNGSLDIYTADYVGGGSTILRNKLCDSNYVKLIIEGFKNNRSAIGAKIYVFSQDHLNDKSSLIYYSEINGGSGYVSINEFRKIIPLKNLNGVIIKIIFPLGQEKIVRNIFPGSTVVVADVEGFQQLFSIVRNFMYRMFFDPHRFFGLLEWLFVIFVFCLSAFRGKRKFNWSSKYILIFGLAIFLPYYILISMFNFRELLLSSILPVSVVLGLIFIQQLFYERISLKKEGELEKQKIREKLSRDLHDDLASTLSSVTIYLELLNKSLNNNSSQALLYFNKANSLLSNAKQSVTDMIWTINPKPETVSEFILKARENFTPLFKENKIKFSIEGTGKINVIYLTAVQKHNLYLIIKESLNNILKYANANKVSVFVLSDNKELVVKIVDNGKGFIPDKARNKGHGLQNMEERCNEINAEFKIDSELGVGTTIEIIVK